MMNAADASGPALPPDYVERVYAGVLGKLIGVYLGRPFEGWTNERIEAELGEIWYYVHDRLQKKLVVTDDDISGTFTFIRALPDYGNRPDITPEQIGQTWLNYCIEHRTILWWGGLGNSTEHTAYLRLKAGERAPASGSMRTNSQVVAEQIGAQIFIDGWALVRPGDPEGAADLARRAAQVSHDGEAVYAAQIVAAMESLAFVEQDIDRLLARAVALVPRESLISRMIADIRRWHEEEPTDWRHARRLLAAEYGYDKYGGNCHVVPNHGLIILALLYGAGDFQRSLMIVNTCGWDTDCNSGNLGCLLGIRGGLAGLDAGPDWRGPVADRMFVSTAAGDAVTDAGTQTFRLVNVGRALAGLPPLAPKDGSRFHFELPGSVQGFRPDREDVSVENSLGHSQAGSRSLRIGYRHVSKGRPASVMTATFIQPDSADMPFYRLFTSPTIYPGQEVRAVVHADGENSGPVTCELLARRYDENDELTDMPGPEAVLVPGGSHEYGWRLPQTGGYPIAEVGVRLRSDGRADGSVYLDHLTWDGVPRIETTRPPGRGTMWQRAWVLGVDHLDTWAEPYRVIQSRGTGLLIYGAREWADYRVTATITPHMAAEAGLAARTQGMERYYALLLCRDDTVRLVRALDGRRVLAEAAFPWSFGETHELELAVRGPHLVAAVDGRKLFDLDDTERPLLTGAVALVCREGRCASDGPRIGPVDDVDPVERAS